VFVIGAHYRDSFVCCVVGATGALLYTWDGKVWHGFVWLWTGARGKLL